MLVQAAPDRKFSTERLIDAGRNGLGVGALGDLHEILQGQRDADGGNQWRQAEGTAQGAVGDAFDGKTVQGAKPGGENEGGKQAKRVATAIAVATGLSWVLLFVISPALDFVDTFDLVVLAPISAIVVPISLAVFLNFRLQDPA